MGTLKPQSNSPLYRNSVIGTLTVDGWAVTFGTAMRGLGGLRPRPIPSSLYQIPPINGSLPTSYCSMWHCNCLCTLKGKIKAFTVTSLISPLIASYTQNTKYQQMQTNASHYKTCIINKKLSCCRKAARCLVSLNMSVSHSRSFNITSLSRACISPY